MIFKKIGPKKILRSKQGNR